MRGLHNRVKRLLAAVPDRTDRKREERRWGRLAEAAVQFIDGAEAQERFADWLARCTAWTRIPGPTGESCRRLPGAAALLLRLLADPALAARAVLSGAVDGNRTTAGDPHACWLGDWLIDLSWLTSRVPPDVEPATLRAIADVFATRRAELDHLGVVCTACGLGRPIRSAAARGMHWDGAAGVTADGYPRPSFRHPELFDGRCPHCGAESHAWPGNPNKLKLDWPELAEAELDPGRHQPSA